MLFRSVSISGGKIFTVAKRKDGQFVVALDLATQKELWSARVSEKGDDPQGAPCVDGQYVFAVSKDGRVLCCDASSGKEIWSKDFEKDFGGKMMSGWGYAESPLVDGDKLIVTPGGTDAVLVALNKKTGAVIWKAPQPAGIVGKGNDGAGYTGAVASNAGGIRQYITLVGHGVLSVAASDGKPLWHYNRVANGTANIPTPLAWDDYVFASSGYGTGAALLKIVKASSATAAPKGDDAKVAELTKKLESLTAEIGKRREHLLGRHVVQRPQNRTRTGETCGSSLIRGRRAQRYGWCRLLGQTKIEQLRAGFGQHDVARLQVAVHDAALVCRTQRVRDADGDRQRVVERQRAPYEPVGQCFALEQFHDEVRRAGLIANVVQRADVRMRQLRDGASFAIESRPKLRVCREVGGQDFDRNRPVETRVSRTIDLSHAARAERADHFIRAETCAWSESHEIECA